jgi:hypothetical protein
VISSPINDMVEFLELINQCSNFPASIVVIQIGEEADPEIQKAEEDANYIKKENYLEVLNTGLFKQYAESVGLEFKQKSPLQQQRRNSFYINFNELFRRENLKSEVILKPVLKKLFREITNQFLDYALQNNISPMDFENLKKKSLHNYLDFRRKRQTEKYQIPNYLKEEKEAIIEEVIKLGYTVDELHQYIKTFPSFEKDYIFNVLNDFKIKNMIRENNERRRSYASCKEYILFEGKPLIDERKNLRKSTKKMGLLMPPVNSTKGRNISTTEVRKINIIGFSNFHNSNNKGIDKNPIIKKGEKSSKNLINICKICEENKINIVFQDCKHKYYCDVCIDDNVKNCPICKERIKSFVRIYNI